MIVYKIRETVMKTEIAENETSFPELEDVGKARQVYLYSTIAKHKLCVQS